MRTSAHAVAEKNVKLSAILLAGMIAGVLDGVDAALFAWITKGIAPTRVFQYIASGLLGMNAFALGMKSVLLGVLLHVAIATFWACMFFLVARTWPSLTAKPLIYGPIFGLVVMVIMRYGVVPLSAARQTQLGTVQLMNLIFAHVFCVGVPIALTLRGFSHISVWRR